MAERQYKVFIGVGHGGNDPGGVANGFKEKDLNLDIAKACRDELKRHNVIVMLNRTTDTTEGLAERIKKCKKFNPDIAADTHNNIGKGDGAEVFHGHDDERDDKLALFILEEMKIIGQNSRGLKTKLLKDGRDYFGFIREISCPSVLIECAFIDNKNDVKIIDTPEERKTMGMAIAKGMLRYLDIDYIPIKETPTQKPVTQRKDKFLPARGYFRKGDTHVNIGKIAAWMRKMYPKYTPEAALGNYFGSNLFKAVKKFQRRTDIEADGNIGPITLATMEKNGFKRG